MNDTLRKDLLSAFEQSTGAAVLGLQGQQIIMANTAACALLGQNQAALLKLRFCHLFRHDNQAEVEHWARRWTAGHTPDPLTLPIYKRTGRVVYVTVIGQALHLNEAPLTLITLLPQAHATQDPHVAYPIAYLLENLPIVLFVMDADGVFTMSEGRGLSGLSLGAGQAVGHSVFELYAAYPDTLAAVRRALSGHIVHTVVSYETAYYETWLFPMLSDTGEVFRVVGAGLDVSEREHALNALRISEQAQHLLISDLSEAIYIFSAELRLLETNYRAAEMMGLTMDTLLSRAWLSRVHPDDQALVQQMLQRMQTGQRIQTEYRLVRDDGSQVDAACSGTRLPDGRYQIIERDITHEKKAVEYALEQEGLRVTLEKEREMGLLRQRLMTTISHEFRTPLAIIMSSVELLERYHERIEAAKRIDYIQRVKKQIEYMASMLDDISLMIKQQGRQAITFIPVNMLTVAKETLRRISQAQPAAAERITLEYDPDGHTLEGRRRYGVTSDTLRAMHILQALLLNAMKYSAPHTPIHITLRDDADWVHVQVKDQGIGIHPDDMTRIFQPMYRGRNAESLPGSGLGLAIVRDYADLLMAEVKVESVPDQGSTFTISFPRRIPPPQMLG